MEPEKKPVRWPLLAIPGVLAALWACAVLAVLVLGGGWFISHNWVARSEPDSLQALSPQEARLQARRGMIEVQGASGAWTPVTRDITITAGQRVRTGELSGVQIAFYDGSLADLDANTEVSIDALQSNTQDTRTQDGERVVVLTQWAGESDHTVTPNTESGARYEVHTASATGAAKGTHFHVSVTADQSTRVSVQEGAVAVTGMEVTVTVNAGEVTLVNANQPPTAPAFRISGQGVVSQTGSTWLIGGEAFNILPSTVIAGSPQIGDMVLVEGHLLPDSTQVADLIVLLRTSPANRFTLSGQAEQIGDTTWTVSGQVIVVSAATTIETGIVVGDQVQVVGEILDDGTLHAGQIHRSGGEVGLTFDFSGVIQEISAQAWKISGVVVKVDEKTSIAAGLAIGEIVRVHGRIQTDETWLAVSIERSSSGPHTFEFSGPLESMNPWRVAGLAFETRDWTEIQDGLKAGDLVHVKGMIQEDGTWVALEIERLDDETRAHIIFIGTVISVDPWVVGGLPLAVTDQTLIVGQIVPGTLVRVEVLLLADGTWQILKIEAVLKFEGYSGCLNVTATVVSVEGNQLHLLNWPTLTMAEEVKIEGELVPNSIIRLQLCFEGETTIRIVTIVVVYQPEGEEPPSTDYGEKVAICHKPGKKGGHTITVARPAVPAHLGHGDRLGACSR